MKLPINVQICLVLLNIILACIILFYTQQIVVPLIFALFISILLNPVVDFLTRHKVPRVVAIFLSLTLTFIVIGGLLFFLFLQVSMFSKSYPLLRDKFDVMTTQAVNWCSVKFNVDSVKLTNEINSAESRSLNSLLENSGKTLLTVGNAMVLVILVPVYIFLIIYYKSLLLEFLRKIFHEKHHPTVVKVLENVKVIIQSYLRGLLIEGAIVAVLNCAALLALGIEYAILLGITGAILNVIPYIGGITAIALPMIIAFITKSWVSALLVMLLYLIIQFFDNHYLVPYIVASKVKINALVAIAVVLVGDLLWGVPGMFLSIPITALIKVIFDNIEPLKPYGFVLGDNIPPVIRLPFVKHRSKVV